MVPHTGSGKSGLCKLQHSVPAYQGVFDKWSMLSLPRGWDWPFEPQLNMAQASSACPWVCMAMALDVGHWARWHLLGSVLMVGVMTEERCVGLQQAGSLVPLLHCLPEDLRFLILGAALFLHGYPTSCRGQSLCSPGVRQCKVHVVILSGCGGGGRLGTRCL